MKILQIILEGTHATGEGAFTPATTQQTTQTTQTPVIPPPQYTGSSVIPSPQYTKPSVIPPPQYTRSSVIPSPQYTKSSVIPPPQYTGSSVIPPHHASSSTGNGRSRRRRTDTEDKMNEIIDILHERHMSKKSRSSTASSVTPNSLEFTAHSASSDFISRVTKFNEIPLAQDLTFLRLKENREIFDLVDDDTAREWLKIEIEREKINMEYKQYVMKKGYWTLKRTSLDFPPS